MLSIQRALLTQFLSYALVCADPAANPDQWSSAAYSAPGATGTVSATTLVLGPDVIGSVDNAAPSYPGVGAFPGSIYTLPGGTITLSATTQTVDAITLSFLVPPAALATQLLGAPLDDVHLIAASVTSLPFAMASKINVDYLSLYDSYTSDHPVPSIFSKVQDDLDVLLRAGPEGEAVSNDVNNILDGPIYPNPEEKAAMDSLLASLLSPYPAISSDVAEYLTAQAAYFAPEASLELSLVQQDLSITNSAAVATLLSAVSAAVATSTPRSTTTSGHPSSTGNAGGTGGSGNSSSSGHTGAATSLKGTSTLSNACLVIACIVVIGIL